MHCPMCFGTPILLNKLGHRVHFRCRNCGWQWDDVDESADESEGEA